MDKPTARARLLQERLALPDRLARANQLQVVLRTWLITRPDTVIGAYWPIKGEFDPLPALHRWQEADTHLQPQGAGAVAVVPRHIGLPVIDRDTRQLTFHAWYPGCPMEEDAYGIPKPKGTERLQPTLLLVPCVGYGPRGTRLGYGGGFYDRTLAALTPRPYTAGLGFSHGWLPDLQPEPHDMPLDALLTDDGVAWLRP
ncbi:MAG: 5-formyltetrahydrofolate cyclo-ligase [Betaproteobacteria bacterium]|nr:5-formyltetrahydrofolate cyclo-ligase [Betaproteobacteria bacterium]